MALNKPSKFGAADGLEFGEVAREVHEVQAKQEVQEPREYGTTQGRKGQKAKRINMAFSDENHDFITKESKKA